MSATVTTEDLGMLGFTAASRYRPDPPCSGIVPGSGDQVSNYTLKLDARAVGLCSAPRPIHAAIELREGGRVRWGAVPHLKAIATHFLRPNHTTYTWHCRPNTENLT